MDKKRRLTAKQERFAQLVAGGEKRGPAYRQAFDADGSNDATVDNEGYDLTVHPDVGPRIDALLEQHAVAAGITQSSVLARVDATADEARSDKQFGPALKGYELLGRHVGLFAEHSTSEQTIRHELTGFSVEERRAMIVELENQRLALTAHAEVLEDNPDVEQPT